LALDILVVQNCLAKIDEEYEEEKKKYPLDIYYAS
jgi:hypothetical protein